ncbi:endonuclease/exonuclease/phosphatase family protein [Streptomyces sp. R39]|uniref:Endonuclease/exonuclease/phosphatase family protein n=1 Tax=Streptomyces sp. R39 TaxID=3238631 RepID=A0AB39QRE5_9ACTN
MTRRARPWWGHSPLRHRGAHRPGRPSAAGERVSRHRPCPRRGTAGARVPGGRRRSVPGWRGAGVAAVAAEPDQRVVVLGDLNGTMDDRAFAGLTARLRSAQEAAGDGFGFSWPAEFPVARIDQILVRGVRPESSWVLPPTGSDHRPVAAAISW